MRLLFTTFPAIGHFHPMAPLALAARDAGHDVLVATGPDLVDWVRRCGLRSTAAGLSQTEATRQALALTPAGAPPTRALFTLVAPRAMSGDLLRLTADWRPDVVVHEESEYAGPLIAAHVGAFCATHSWNAPAKAETTRQQATAAVSPLWAGLPGPPRVTGDVYLDACPPPLQSADIASLPNVIRVRPVPFDGPVAVPASSLDDLDRPLAYVTFGTVPEFSTAARLRVAAAAVESVAESLAGSVVVTCGPNDTSALGRFGGRVHVVQYLPQSLILPLADLVVSHGGAGTTLGALIAGIGHVVLPQGAPSQFRNAARVAALGLGVSIAPPDQTGERIAEAARHVLAADSFRRAARGVREQLDASPAPAEVLHLLT